MDMKEIEDKARAEMYDNGEGSEFVGYCAGILIFKDITSTISSHPFFCRISDEIGSNEFWATPEEAFLDGLALKNDIYNSDFVSFVVKMLEINKGS